MKFKNIYYIIFKGALGQDFGILIRVSGLVFPFLKWKGTHWFIGVDVNFFLPKAIQGNMFLKIIFSH